MVTLTDTLPHPSPSSLTLITSTLGAPSSWLLNAYIAETLRPQSHTGNGPGRAVVLVSFVNDGRFWREGLRRGVSTCPAGFYFKWWMEWRFSVDGLNAGYMIGGD